MRYCLQWHAETATNADRKRSGRPRVTSIAEDKNLIVSSKSNRRRTSPQLSAEFNCTCQHPISAMTVKRSILSVGLKGCVSVQKHELKRLKWPQQQKDWTLEDWEKVLWTGDSKFELWGSKQRMFVRQTLSELMSENCIVPTVKHDGGGAAVMVWGCFRGEISWRL